MNKVVVKPSTLETSENEMNPSNLNHTIVHPDLDDQQGAAIIVEQLKKENEHITELLKKFPEPK